MNITSLKQNMLASDLRSTGADFKSTSAGIVSTNMIWSRAMATIPIVSSAASCQADRPAHSSYTLVNWSCTESVRQAQHGLHEGKQLGVPSLMLQQGQQHAQQGVFANRN
jgi:hypothetical protein